MHGPLPRIEIVPGFSVDRNPARAPSTRAGAEMTAALAADCLLEPCVRTRDRYGSKAGHRTFPEAFRALGSWRIGSRNNASPREGRAAPPKADVKRAANSGPHAVNVCGACQSF